MTQDLLGLLSGVRTPQEKLTADINEGNQAALLTPGRGGIAMAPRRQRRVTEGLGRILGIDTRNPQEQVQEQVMQLLQANTPESLAQAAQVLHQAGDTEGALKVMQAGKELSVTNQGLQDDAEFRQTLSDQARGLGLDETAELALSRSADTGAIALEIREEERRQFVNESGRTGRVVLASSVGADPNMIRDIGRGVYDNLDGEGFLAVLEGDEGKTKAFLDREGTTSIFKESEQGNIWDDEQGKWVTPGELGLRAAPVRTETLSTSNVFADGVIGAAKDNFNIAYEAAQEAQLSLANNTQSTGLIDNNIISGAFGTLTLNISNALITAGLIDEGSTAAATVANTQAYMSTRAIEVGRIIKLFGAGTGLSDADREYAEKIVAGNITMTEEAMRRLLAMSKIATTNVIMEFDKDLDEKVARGLLDEEQASLFRLQQPGEIPRDFKNFTIDGRPQTVGLYEIRPGRWVTFSGIPVEDLGAEIR